MAFFDFLKKKKEDTAETEDLDLADLDRQLSELEKGEPGTAESGISPLHEDRRQEPSTKIPIVQKVPRVPGVGRT